MLLNAIAISCSSSSDGGGSSASASSTDSANSPKIIVAPKLTGALVINNKSDGIYVQGQKIAAQSDSSSSIFRYSLDPVDNADPALVKWPTAQAVKITFDVSGSISTSFDECVSDVAVLTGSKTGDVNFNLLNRSSCQLTITNGTKSTKLNIVPYYNINNKTQFLALNNIDAAVGEFDITDTMLRSITNRIGFILNSDIQLDATTATSYISSVNKLFLEGSGKTISGIKIEAISSFDSVGLIGQVMASTILNLKLNVISIDTKVNDGIVDKYSDTVGSLAGNFDGTLDNIEVISSGVITGRACVGGVLGTANGIINSVKFSGSVIGYAGNVRAFNVGGIAGVNNAKISNSSASGTIIANNNLKDANIFGGLVGANSGKIIKSNASVTITQTTATSAVALSNTGGLVGENFGIIQDSLSTGNLPAGTNIGSLVGANKFNGKILKSNATGTVGGVAGDLVGHNYGDAAPN